MISMSVPLPNPLQWYSGMSLYGPLSGQYRTWAMIYPLVQFSKSLSGMYDMIHTRSSEMNLGLHKYLCRITFQSSSFSRTSQVYQNIPGLPLVGLPAQKLGSSYSALVFLQLYRQPSSERTERKINSGGIPIFSGPQLPQLERKVCFLQGFRCLWVLSVTAMVDCLVAGAWENKGRKKRKLRDFPNLAWVLGVLFPASWVRTKGLLSELSLSLLQCLLPGLRLPWVLAERDQKTHRRLTAGSVVLQMLAFFSSLPATIYFSESLHSCFMGSLQVLWLYLVREIGSRVLTPCYPEVSILFLWLIFKYTPF